MRRNFMDAMEFELEWAGVHGEGRPALATEKMLVEAQHITAAARKWGPGQVADARKAARTLPALRGAVHAERGETGV